MTVELEGPDAIIQIQQQIGCKLIQQKANTVTFRLAKPLRIHEYFRVQKITGATHGEITCNTPKQNFHTLTVRIPIIMNDNDL